MKKKKKKVKVGVGLLTLFVIDSFFALCMVTVAIQIVRMIFGLVAWVGTLEWISNLMMLKTLITISGGVVLLYLVLRALKYFPFLFSYEQRDALEVWVKDKKNKLAVIVLVLFLALMCFVIARIVFL